MQRIIFKQTFIVQQSILLYTLLKQGFSQFFFRNRLHLYFTNLFLQIFTCFISAFKSMPWQSSGYYLIILQGALVLVYKIFFLEIVWLCHRICKRNTPKRSISNFQISISYHNQLSRPKTMSTLTPALILFYPLFILKNNDGIILAYIGNKLSCLSS